MKEYVQLDARWYKDPTPVRARINELKPGAASNVAEQLRDVLIRNRTSDAVRATKARAPRFHVGLSYTLALAYFPQRIAPPVSSAL